jgi:spore coat polysaccharide biosynthesis predicted glycosyltransferase SpsG
MSPIVRLDGINDVEIAGWVSDFTHLREQLLVMEELGRSKKVCFITNKSDIADYIKKNTFFKVGFFKFNNKNVFKVSLIIQKHIPQLKYSLIGNDLRSDDGLFANALKMSNISYGVITHGINFLNTRLNESKANHLFVWTEEEKQRMINQGISEQRIINSGSPYLFTVKQNFTNCEKQFDSNHNLAARTKILVAISGAGNLYSIEEHLLTINHLNTLALKLKETHFFINKLHRKDREEYYQNCKGLNVVDENIIPIQLSKILPLIQNCDLIISGASTSVIEAMCLQKPVIIFDKNPKTKSLPFVEEGVVLFCTETEMLKQHIASLNNLGYLKECIVRQNQFINEHFNITTDPAKIIAQQISAHLNNN